MKLPRSIFPIIFSFLTLIFVTKLEAQFLPMADDSNRWGVTSSWADETSGFITQYTYTYAEKVDGTVLINDSLFHKVWYKKLKKRASGPGGNYDSVFTDSKYIHNGGLVYEDENIGFFTCDKNRNLQLVWDYRFEEGDTIPAETLVDQPADLIIDSISIYTDSQGMQRRQWFVSISEDERWDNVRFENQNEPASFVEGIGTFGENGGGFIYGFNYRYFEENGDNGYRLDCFAYNGEPVYGTCADAVLSIKEPVELSLELYPNPVKNGRLNLNTDFRGSLKLYDLHGRELLQAQVQFGFQSVEVSQLETGVYTLVLKSDAGGQVVRRVQLGK